MLKKQALIITILYSIALATVCLVNINNLPHTNIYFEDKIFHFLAYGLLTYLWFNSLINSIKFKKKRAIFLAAIISVIFGILIEVIQENMTVSRALDVYDVLANTLGTLLVSIALWFKNRLHVKNS